VREKVLGYIRDRKLLRAGDRVAVAVSGGADSVALLRVLIDLRSELGVVVSVAHFNHGLRGEASDADEAFVAELANQHDLEFFSGRGDVRDYALTGKLGLEVAARDLRYRWLASVAESNKLNAIATGHTLDDQAETVLLKFLRGAGTRGLAGIYPVLQCLGGVVSGAKALNHPKEPYGMPKGVPLQVRIVRPMLEVTREEVEQYLTALGQPWREDESNLDRRFARNRVRHDLLPLLQPQHLPGSE
jgi:tRNA(Ile)-lysidine synthase